MRVMAQILARKGLTSRQPKACIALGSIITQKADIPGPMIDNFALALTHGLLLIAAWRLTQRDDVDLEEPPEKDKEPSGFGAKPGGGGWDA